MGLVIVALLAVAGAAAANGLPGWAGLTAAGRHSAAAWARPDTAAGGEAAAPEPAVTDKHQPAKWPEGPPQAAGLPQSEPASKGTAANEGAAGAAGEGAGVALGKAGPTGDRTGPGEPAADPRTPGEATGHEDHPADRAGEGRRPDPASGGGPAPPPGGGAPAQPPSDGSAAGEEADGALPAGSPASPAETADPPPAQDGGPLVVAYYAEDWLGDVRALNALRAAGARVDRVVNFALELHADGSITTRSYPDLAAAAAELGIPVYGLVHNMENGWFSADIARAVLADPERRSRAVADMLAIAQAHGLAGIDIDIENVPGDLRPVYTALVAEAAALLKPHGLQLTVSVPAKTWDDTTSNWGGAYDYARLGALADQVAIMAYDEHTWGLPHGPVASLPWVERVVAYAVTQIPREKILLGIPAYGYDWIAGTRHVVQGLSTGGAYTLAAQHGAEVLWDDEAQVPYFRYAADGVEHVVYFENDRSAAAKLRLVGEYGLGGIAIWRLGLGEASLWDAIDEGL